MQKKKKKITRIEFCPWQFEAINNPYTHFAMIGGISVGKSFTGAHFCIKNIIEHPELTGFVGANCYDQLSQASLRELMFWLTQLGFQYVVDCKPPKEWNAEKKFKDYKNILSVRNRNNHVTTIFTRVLSDGDALRGIQFSWYWIDETRDTPLNTHDVILSRLRENKKYIKGLVTTTPNAEDWVFKRFVECKNAQGIFGYSHTRTIESVNIFGYSHTRTIESVNYGIITEAFYLALRAAYSPAMAAQELDAEHVCVLDGRVYYVASEKNKRREFVPNIDYPLVVGCDFNFSPAPMCWVIGQVSENGKTVHWFDELSDTEIGTATMARRLGAKYRDFYLRIFGDASGNRGTTAAAGNTDFMQIADELNDMGVEFSIDVDQMNPMVKDRVENINRLLCNANGEVAMTFDPDRCPHLSRDMDKVVWKKDKLSGNGDHQLTHASDACGYVLWKLFPPQSKHLRTINSVASPYAHLRG